jgi:hypothetical protein
MSKSYRICTERMKSTGPNIITAAERGMLTTLETRSASNLLRDFLVEAGGQEDLRQYARALPRLG